VNEGPTGTPPEETPSAPEPTPEPTPAQQPASWEVPAHTPPPAAAEPAPYVPPPDYAAPPGYAAPVAAAPPRNMRPIITTVAIVVVLLLVVIGYAAAGFAFATSRIDSARTAYNAVVAHQNSITDTVNSFNSKFTTSGTSTTSADLKADRTLLDQVVSKSQAAGTTITTDDASLATAQSSLTDNSWLTVFSRSSLDNYSAKIGHERKALADAKILAADYVQMGTFYQAFFDAVIDLDTVGTDTTNSDFAGAAAAVSTMKADLAKALSASNAPGLPPEVHAFVVDFQAFGTDIGALLAAVNSGDVSNAQSLSAKVDADVSKLDAYDFTKIGNEIDAYYKPTIDDFNAEISKANAM
jgi:hypothetical protein